jgi:hypothetical protein
VRKLLPFVEGDRIELKPGYDDGSAVARALGVPQVNLEFVCCTPEQKVIAFVGVAETAPPPRLEAPKGPERLPETIMRTHDEFMARFWELISSGRQAPSDHSQGHYLDPDAALRMIQERFLLFARENAELAMHALANSADPRHRAVAAIIVGYLPDKKIAAGALTRASSDPDPTVRNNATRALSIIAEYSLAHPELEIRIDAKPFIALLNSPTWTDLNKGILVINWLSASRNPALLAELRQKARPALIDICRWQSPGHAEPGCTVLRRVEALPDRPGPEGRAEVLARAGAVGTQPPSGTSPRNR